MEKSTTMLAGDVGREILVILKASNRDSRAYYGLVVGYLSENRCIILIFI